MSLQGCITHLSVVYLIRHQSSGSPTLPEPPWSLLPAHACSDSMHHRCITLTPMKLSSLGSFRGKFLEILGTSLVGGSQNEAEVYYCIRLYYSDDKNRLILVSNAICWHKSKHFAMRGNRKRTASFKLTQGKVLVEWSSIIRNKVCDCTLLVSSQRLSFKLADIK